MDVEEFFLLLRRARSDDDDDDDARKSDGRVMMWLFRVVLLPFLHAARRDTVVLVRVCTVPGTRYEYCTSTVPVLYRYSTVGLQCLVHRES